MDPEHYNSSGKYSTRKVLPWIVLGIFTIIIISGIFIYRNFNRLLSEALIKSFNTSIVSDVYDLNFSDLRINIYLGNIRVENVEIRPKKIPLKNYPYINSSIELQTREIVLADVEIGTLLKQNKLKLGQINIENPQVLITVADELPIFLPFNESKVVNDTVPKSFKNAINAYFLENFNLKDASLHIVDLAKERDLRVANVNISISDIKFDQQPGKDLFSYSLSKINIGEVEGILKKKPVKHVILKDYKSIVNSLEVEKSIDTLIYRFKDFQIGFKDADIQTADSIFHLSFHDLSLMYSSKSLAIKNVVFLPNKSEKAIQRMYKFQNTQFQGSAALVKFSGINFDSLLYQNKIFVDEIRIDSIKADIFKDRTKPIDFKKIPEYPGQLISFVNTPVLIKQISATNVELAYEEIKPDKNRGKANVNTANFQIENITNINKNQPLLIKTDALLENKAHFNLHMNFDYNKPEFVFKGNFSKFNLKDLSPLIQSFTPASINNGFAEKIEFNGTAKKNKADATMKFLYRDLSFNLNFEDKAAWKNSVLSFAANAVVNSSNPASEGLPPRIVKYQVQRNMNKSFINFILLSVLSGLKETVFMSKENKQRYKQAKKEMRKELKESTD